jgi:hypothetical protein
LQKKKFQGIMPTNNFLALISFMHEKWVGLNILGESALIILALVSSPILKIAKVGKAVQTILCQIFLVCVAH